MDFSNYVKIASKLEDNGEWNLYVDTREDYNRLIASHVSEDEAENILKRVLGGSYNENDMMSLTTAEKLIAENIGDERIKEIEQIYLDKYSAVALKIKEG